MIADAKTTPQHSKTQPSKQTNQHDASSPPCTNRRPLNMAERKEFNRAKIYGFLRMNNLCKQPVCNKVSLDWYNNSNNNNTTSLLTPCSFEPQYLSYCWHRQRPYVAINKHGDVMVVDLRPVNGFGALESADRFDSVSNAVSMLIEDHWMTGLQIVNDMQPESVRPSLPCLLWKAKLQATSYTPHAPPINHHTSPAACRGEGECDQAWHRRLQRGQAGRR